MSVLLSSFVGAPSREGIEAIIAESFPDYAETFEPFGVTNAVFPAANNALLIRRVARRDLTIASISIFVATASGNVDAGIYLPSGADFARLGSSGSTAAAGAGAEQVLAISGGAIEVERGAVFFFALAADNGTVSLARLANTSSALGAIDGVLGAKASSFPLPATITASLGVATYAPWMRTSAS